MQANTNQWYVKWFLWSCRVLDQWRNDNGGRERQALKRGTNLCEFFRTLLWGVLISAWSIMLWVYMVVGFLVLPFLLYGAAKVAITVGFVLAVFVAIGVAVSLICGVPMAASWVTKKISQAASIKPNQPPSFFKICWAHIVGIKKRFCPMISFKDTDRE